MQLLKIALPYIRAVFIGIIILVGGSVIVKFFIEPLREFSRVKTKITESLVHYANVYLNPGWSKEEKMAKAYEVLRQRASELTAITDAIRCYKLWQFLKIIPKKSDAKVAENRLIGLSNSVYDRDQMENNRTRLKEIEKVLHIKTGISV